MRECVYTSLIKSHYAGVGLLFLRCDICILVRQPHDALISLHSYLVRNGATNRSLNDYLRYDGIRRYRTFLFFTRMIMKIKPGVQLVRYDDYLANPWPFHAGASALSEESLNRILDRTSREKTTKNKDNIADKEFSKKKDYSEVNIEKNLLDEIGELTRKFQSL